MESNIQVIRIEPTKGWVALQLQELWAYRELLYFKVLGRPCALVYATLDNEKRPSQSFRTLLLQETIKRGILAPSFAVSYCHADADIDRTVEAVHEALYVYRRALNEGIEKYLIGRSVKPVFRRYA
jgi:glutamate-1-semialdehyde 2,1-aminomutase